MNRKVTAGQVFAYMTSVGGSAAYIAWAGIVFTHLGISKAFLDQPTHSKLGSQFGSIDSICF